MTKRPMTNSIHGMEEANNSNLVTIVILATGEKLSQ